jgi:hypothetical protein
MRHPPPSEEEPSDDGSDDSELEVALDQDGRVVFGDTSQLDFSFRSLRDAVPASDPQRVPPCNPKSRRRWWASPSSSCAR